MTKSEMIDGVFGPAMEGPAEDVMMDAWEAASVGKRRSLARKALNIDLDCIDAYVLLALHAQSLAEQISILKEAVAVGNRIWEPYLEFDDMPWWIIMGTRPYMRALHNLGLALEEAGYSVDAEDTYKHLLNLNSNDNQGIRYLLLRMWTEQGRLKDCATVLKEYPDDYGLEAIMTKLLVDLSKNNRKSAKSRMADMLERNEHVLPCLKIALQKNRWPKSNAAMIAMGSKDEANSYLEEFQHGWLANPNAVILFNELFEN